MNIYIHRELPAASLSIYLCDFKPMRAQIAKETALNTYNLALKIDMSTNDVSSNR